MHTPNIKSCYKNLNIVYIYKIETKIYVFSNSGINLSNILSKLLIFEPQK